VAPGTRLTGWLGPRRVVSLMKSFMPEWDALIVPGSKQGEVWTEVESLRAEFTQP